jgi:hypothetical protein
LKRTLTFHPLLFAIYPTLALLAANAGHVVVWEALRPALISLALAALLWGLFRLMVKPWSRAALLATLALALFFSYGHIQALISGWGLFNGNLQPQQVLLPLWAVLLALGAWALSRIADPRRASQYLNWVALVLLAFPLYTIISAQIGLGAEGQSLPTPPSPEVTEQASTPQAEALDEYPDIYYIILDAYARADVLAELYDYDNSDLIDFLEERGFYVADGSHANYNQTFLSIPSSLNMTFIPDLLGVKPEDAYDHSAHYYAIRNNEVFELLKAFDYQVVGFATGHSLTNLRNADHYLAPEEAGESPEIKVLVLFGHQVSLYPFELLLLETTALQPALDTALQSQPEDPAYQLHRQRVQFTFSELAHHAGEDGHYFVFAHIICPHPPFVFQADGQPKVNSLPYSIADGSHFVGYKGTRQEYIEGYRAQVAYVNTLLEEAIDRILAASETPPVIIIQGDHGPGAYFRWNSLEKSNLSERLSILNAYYFPGGDEGWLYPSITPVNSFRVLFNRYFGMDFELLDDAVYFSNWSTPYDFVDITERLASPQ